MGKKKDFKNIYSLGLSVVDTEKKYNRNQDSIYHTSLGGSDLKDLIKGKGEGKLRINFSKEKSKWQGGEKPDFVPDETKARTSASIGKDYIGFNWKKKFSDGGIARGGGAAIKGLKFEGVK